MVRERKIEWLFRYFCSAPPPPPPNSSAFRVTPAQLNAVLSHVDDWQFDAFKLSECSHGRPLSMLSFVLFKRLEVISKYGLDETKLVKFLMKVEDGYPTNP